MQLTRLEIKGFKSFADKVTINFGEGITGIVGPNGCGKSNVVDSIRWVLGEQKTRVLRSEKMENIIFNGTKNRKATQLAEVSLTFENTKNLIPTEYSQVTITRKYFRSGESEYQLNGVTCRLKDITNLFLDTGIASNTYAIIELKMVDDLLNDKDNSRRNLFEEAAGISKFKIRKKETLRKLSDTDADLDRVEDLLFEIEKNLKSLERQANQAKRFYELKDEYKNASIAFADRNVRTHQEVHDTIELELKKEQDKKETLTTQLAELEALLAKTKTDLVSKEKLLSSRQKSLNEHVNKIRTYESEKKIKSERQRFLQDKIEGLKGQIEQDKQSNERASFSLQSLRADLANEEKELEILKELVEGLQVEYETQKSKTTAAQERLEELNAQFLASREAFFQHNKDLEIKEMQLSALRQELFKTGEDRDVHSTSLQEFEAKTKSLEEERKNKIKTFDKIKSAQETLANKEQKTQEKIEQLRNELSEINRVFDARQNEYNLTKSLVDSLEGFPEAIRFLKKSDWKKGPLVSDILTCPEDIRICIENYLEPYMNYYVVDRLDEAVDAVNLLHEAGRGRANFFVLEQLTSNFKLQTVEGAQSALEQIEYDDKYTPLIEFLLGNVFIYDENLPKTSSELVLLDKSGKLIHRHSGIAGGSVGMFEGKRIGRAKNLEKLAKEIKQLETNQTKVTTRLHQTETELLELRKNTRQEELDLLRDEINTLNESLAGIKSKQEQFASLLSTTANRREDIEEQISVTSSEIEALMPEVEKESASLSEIEKKVTATKKEVDDLNELLADKSAAFNEVNVRFHRQQNKVNSTSQEISYKEESYNSSLKRIEINNEELRTAEHAVNEIVQTTTSSDDELVAMYAEKESIESGVNEAEKAYYHTRGAIDEHEKEIREVQRLRETSDHIFMEWQNKLNETKLELNSVKDRLSVEFNIAYAKIDKEVIDVFKKKSDDDLEQLVGKLKNRIDNMGPINPMAMEAYEEIKERHDFITGQKDDLIRAKESLLSTIEEIDTVAKETFLDAFGKIKENFINVFRTLFTDEDDCDLFLTDPDNPLESSIDITAKPKGKRPLTINQLSGGEKTLTATSLLFAIYLLKPAPFCIFDEVDAPLDDANIDKFNQIIREFSKDSQFIIVTHNKRTMASTDIIYGITMIEQGISKVVPVDLRELA